MTTEITRDAIFELARNADGFVVEFDGPWGYRLMDVLHNDHGTGYAHSRRTGMVARFRPLTGIYRKTGTAAVVVTYAQDSGDMAGTLVFDEGVDSNGEACEPQRGQISNNLLSSGADETARPRLS
jgi:hypothetical protein